MSDENTWKLKIDDESKSPVFAEPEKEGEMPKPIYLNPEGKEIALDPVGMYNKIIEMGKNEKELRGNKKRLESQLELFADIDDISEWKENADKAIETVKNFNDKDWMEAKKVEALKSDMKEAHDKKLAQVQESYQSKEVEFGETINKKDKQIRQLMVSAKFATHPLFSGSNPKTSLPPEIAETYFGKHFKVEEKDDGSLELMAYYDDGNPVYSHEKPGELANFHEAMYSIFDKSPFKDSLIKGKESGSGSGGGSNDGDGDGDELAKLRQQHAEATEAKDVGRAIALKNKIFVLEQRRRSA